MPFAETLQSENNKCNVLLTKMRKSLAAASAVVKRMFLLSDWKFLHFSSRQMFCKSMKLVPSPTNLNSKKGLLRKYRVQLLLKKGIDVIRKGVFRIYPTNCAMLQLVERWLIFIIFREIFWQFFCSLRFRRMFLLFLFAQHLLFVFHRHFQGSFCCSIETFPLFGNFQDFWWTSNR